LPRVTVVIATYNWSEVLPYSIASALEQTFTDFEVMVVGDCCTDDSAEVVASFDDPRVSWLNLPANTRHQSGPNNEAIRRSDSELIAYLGHDDLWLPHHLDVLVAALSGTTGMSHGSSLLVLPTGTPTAYPRGNWSYWEGMWLPPTSVVHSRSIAAAIGGWRPPWETGVLDSDPDMWLRLAIEAGRPPIWVRDVTAVKLPAGLRPDVYLTRPCHEQQQWLERIRGGESWTGLLDVSRRERIATTMRAGAVRAIPPAVRSWSRQSGRRPRWLTRKSGEQRWREMRETKGVDRAN
jgi:glycosyltransferase involved in cell wall biosynthesis